MVEEIISKVLEKKKLTHRDIGDWSSERKG
jgi:hypothetical protein